ncbi:dTMP kinase [Rhabdaerophilum sp.]|uniref:dTMP kinase n=1 Tax=Rhabdaerophilum sp. TaxID=2717341 RepID=UPI0038D3CB62
MRGIFITFEGGEGAGKSTQIRRLAAVLESYGLSVTLTREPGGTPLAEAIRGLILTHEAASEDGLTQALLFAAARRDHVLRVIRPALAAGHVVLCDRFADSSRAYQGGKVPDAMLEQVIALGTDGLVPDLTFLLDVNAELGLERARSRFTGVEDTFERSNLAFHREVRRRFHAIAASEPHRFIVIDASQDEAYVAESIRLAVRQRIFAVPGVGE